MSKNKKKQSLELFRKVVTLGCDLLANSELIRNSPVWTNTMEFGIVTVRGNGSMLRNGKDILDGIMETGMWNVIWNNMDLIHDPKLFRNLGSEIQKVRDVAFISYGLSKKVYNFYLHTLSSIKFSVQPRTFFLLLKNMGSAAISISKDIKVSIDSEPFDIR